MTRIVPITVLLSVVLATAPLAHASERDAAEGEAGQSAAFAYQGLPDGPVLVEDVEGASLIFRFSGVTDSGDQVPDVGDAATAVHCTNFGASDVDVEVQVTDWDGTLYSSSMNLTAQRTATFCTHNLAAYFCDVIIGGLPGTLDLNQGAGQVFATGGPVRCTAQVLDPQNTRPVYVSGLEMF